MRNLFSNLVRPLAATGWLRAGILVLLLAAFAALAAPAAGAEPVETTNAHALIDTVQNTGGEAHEAVAAVHGVDIVASRRTPKGAPEQSFDGVHAWAG